MEVRDTPHTQTCVVTESIKREIVEARLVPGSKLKIRELSERYNVGGTPVREALSRLLNSSLVMTRDRRGFYVAPVTIAELDRLTWARIGVESMALEAALERGDVAWEAQVVSAFHVLKSCNRSTEFDSREFRLWDEAHQAFHLSLLSACDAPWLMDFVDTLYDQSARYRWMAMRHSPSRFERDALDEHTALVDAVLKRDSERAVPLLADHYRRTSLLCQAVLNEKPHS